MNIIIPMAGHSRRFKQAGYQTLKPFIMIDGNYMIQRVCQMFYPTDNYIFVCNREHLKNKEYRNILESIVPQYKIVEIEAHEYGPTYSALQAEPYLSERNGPIIISYCDFTVQWDYRRFLMQVAHYEGAIPVFKGFHPASFGDTYYAYVKANQKMEMVELREKQSFTENRSKEFASTGVYYWESWDCFSHYAKKIMSKKPEGLLEYYCSLLFNPMVQDGKRICLFEVDKFICWGTPEDLEEYIFWSQYFGNDANRIMDMEFDG